MTIPRRKVLQLASASAAVAAIPRVARAQSYPNRPITIIVPYGAGGTTDGLTRVIADHMSSTLGQKCVIENVPGAGGTTGSIRAMRAAPDGHTILMGQMGTHAVSVSLYPDLAYRPDSDFEPIGVTAEFSLVIVARKDFPAKDLKEFVAYVKANGASLNVAHAGVGSSTFVFALLLNSELGVKPTLIPFGGAAQATSALLAGHVDYMCTGVLEASPHVRAGTIKAYAIGSPERLPALPDVPTSKEGGLPEFQALTWFALFAPKGTSPSVLDMLTQALDRALDNETVRQRLVDIGGAAPDKGRRGQQPLAALVKSEIARWTPIIRAANVRAG